MSTVINAEVFEFDELSAEAKEKARRAAIVMWRGFDAAGNCINESIGRPAAIRSAAPELLATLESLRAALPELEDPNEPLAGTAAVDVLCEHWSRITAAIAKARGES